MITNASNTHLGIQKQKELLKHTNIYKTLIMRHFLACFATVNKL